MSYPKLFSNAEFVDSFIYFFLHVAGSSSKVMKRSKVLEAKSELQPYLTLILVRHDWKDVFNSEDIRQRFTAQGILVSV